MFADPDSKWSWVLFPNLRNCLATPSDIEHGYQMLELEPKVQGLWEDHWEEFLAGV